MTETKPAWQGLAADEKRELLARLLREKAAKGPAQPLSHGQRALWLLHQMAPQSAAYNVAFSARTRSSLDTPALARALHGLVQRHEMLRTTYSARGGEPVQQVHATIETGLDEVDASGWTAEELKQGLASSYARPFDLERGPVIRATLFRQSASEHVLLVTVHHIAYDGLSIGLLVGDLLALYGTEREGRPASLPPLGARYADFVRWQDETLAGAAGEEMWAYWQKQLRNPLPTLQIATDKPRPSTQSFRGSTHPFRIEEDLAARLRDLARQQGATPYMVLFAAFAALLHRYTDQEDVLVGSPTAGRSRREFEGLIGYFVNPVVLRADLSGDPTFAQHLARVRTVVVEALKHADFPFPLLVQRLNPERDPSRSPLFQVDFNVVKLGQLGAAGASAEDGVVSRLSLGGLDLEVFSIAQQEGQFDLTLELVDTGAALIANLKYATDLFDAATVARMEGHLQVLLRGIVERPEARLSALPLLTDAERVQALSGWNADARYPKDVCLHQRFERQVERTPNSVAVVFEGQRLSYHELNRRANQLAHRLRELGVGPDRLVGLRTERNLEMVVGMLGILKAGGAYLPLDPAYPRDRVDFMLRDSGASVVVTQKSLAADLEGIAETRVFLDEPSGPETNPTAAVGPDHLAYVIYTSGSTGTPKGVQISHHNVTRLFDATDEWYRFGADDVWSLFHSYAFDFSVWELWGALLYGGRLVVVPYWVSRAPDAFRELLVREGVTVLNQTPAAFRQLVQADLALPAAAFALRYVIFGGEALELQSLRPWFDRYGDAKPQLVNMYGITETTVHVTYRPIRVADLEAGAGSVIGMPIPDLQLYVLDAHRQLVPIGVAGEMYVGGAGVARGYLNRPELSDERFIEDPFRPQAGARLYRSGDLARRGPSGDLEYLGRIDHQVKIRGFRIELGEIEAAIAHDPGVREVVVVVREDVPGDRRLVAYLVPDGPAAALVEALRGRLRDKLPEYMVPAHFVVLDAFPLTPNGKLDRKKLPVPERSVREGTRYVAPRTPTEEILAGVWEEVLKLERVGVEDEFFELGGHSLLATQVVSRARKALGVELPLRELFNEPTVAGLAARVDALRATSQGQPAGPPLVADGTQRSLELSYAQQRLWFLDQIEPGSEAYVIAGALRIRGPLDEDALESAMGVIVARHESVRMTFSSVNGQARVMVSPAGPWPLPRVNLSAEPGGPAGARRIIAKEAQRPYDLSVGPLFRTVLYRLGPDEHVLLLSMHHIVSDGWSLGVLVRELGAAYAACAAGREASLPALPVQYLDYARWQRACMEGTLERQLGYWRTQLLGAPPFLDLPTDRPRPPVESHRGATLSFDWSGELADRLRGLARAEGATLFMTLLAAFQVVLSRHSGQSQVVVGSPVANRSRPEIEGLIGFFVNTLVLRTDLGGDPTGRQLLARVREVCLGAWAHSELPFEKLVEDLRPERDASRNPVFQVMFVFQNLPPDALALPGLSVAAYELERTAAQVDLTLHLWETKQGLEGAFEYVTDLFDAATIERLAGHLRRLLEGIVAAPEKRLSDLPLLTAGEEQRFAGWNANEQSYPSACVHDLIVEQARRDPGRVAAECGNGQLSFGELEDRSGRLAEHLRGLGVGPDVLVGIFMDRSLDMLVGLLAILRAGGAYVPLDPAYPAERLAYMIECSGACVVVTQRALSEALPSGGLTAVCVDGDWGDQRADASLPSEPGDLAYVIFTSGSTGQPKGVAVTHSSLVNLLASMAEKPGLTARDTLLSVTTLSFDIAGLELYLPLLVGARLVLVERDDAADGHALSDRLTASRATVMQATPATWRLLLEAGWEGTPGLKALCGGEALPRDLANQLLRRSEEVWNVYGPTETTIWSSAWRVEAGDGPVPIGSPIDNTMLYVLDRKLNAVPVGVSGELFIGGDGLARGYWGRPDLTADRFLPDPFAKQAGARMYATGDLARRLTDGTIECLGRLDHQVKVRGFRIELGEIEATLRRHPGIEGAVVLAQDVAGGDRRLVAYLAHGSSGQPNVTGLRNHLKASLPTYMIPSSFVFLDRLPLTPNGKLDRKALAQLESGLTSGAKSHVAPRTPAEVFIAQLWREALGVERVGVRDNFFDLGGHSLLAMRVLAAIEKRTGHRLHPRDIIFQTLEQLAARFALEPSGSEPALRRGLARRVFGFFQALVRGGQAPTPEA